MSSSNLNQINNTNQTESEVNYNNNDMAISNGSIVMDKVISNDQVVPINSVSTNAVVSNNIITTSILGEFYNPATRNSEMFIKHQSTYANWERYESQLSKDTITVLNKLTESCSTITSEKNDKKIIIRTHIEAWIELRKDSKFSSSLGLPKYSNSIVSGIVSGTVNNSRLSGADKIRATNTKKKFIEEMNNANVRTAKNPLMNENFIEPKVVECIYLIESLITAKSVDNRELCDVWFGIGKFIQELEVLEVRDSITNNFTTISVLVGQDLRTKYQQFVERYQSILNYRIVSDNYAELFIRTSFDKILPECSFNPYKSQVEMMEFVNNNLSRPFMCVYKTIMGMGKTTVVAALAKLLDRKDKTKTLIYVCPEGLNAVREMVGSLIFYFQDNFAIAYTEGSILSDGTYKIRIDEQNLCKSRETKPTVILTGVNTIVEMLKKPIHIKKTAKRGRKPVEYEYTLNPSDYVVFFDENTVTLDEPNSPMIQFLSEFYHYMPSQVIFSSATHPEIEKLERLRGYAGKRYPEMVFETIDFSEVKIGTQLNNMNGQMVIPHNKCVNIQELEEFIQIVKNNLMYKKFYTFSLVNSMYDKLIALGFSDNIDSRFHFKNYMDEFSHRNQESIQNLGIIYLELVLELSRNDNNLIQAFNSINVFNTQIDYDNLVESAKVLKGQTFISCLDPYQEMMIKFGSYIQMVKDEIGFTSFRDIKIDYDNKKEAEERILQSELKAMTNNQKISQLERTRMELNLSSNISDSVIPTRLSFTGAPVCLSHISSENIPDSEEYDNLLFAALLGIVVYRRNSNSIYHDMVKGFMSKTICKFVFADSSFNYGNSFPFNNGIILDEMEHHSANTLLQLIGRAGRRGLSSYAIIYAGNKICQKLFDPIYNKNYIDWEKINLDKSIKYAGMIDVEFCNKNHLDLLIKKLNNSTNNIQELFVDKYIKVLEAGLKFNIKNILLDLSQENSALLTNELKTIFSNAYDSIVRPSILIEKFSELAGIYLENSTLTSSISEIMKLSQIHQNMILNTKSLIIKKIGHKINMAKEQGKEIWVKYSSNIKKLISDEQFDIEFQRFTNELDEFKTNVLVPLETHAYWDNTTIEPYNELVAKVERYSIISSRELDIAKQEAHQAKVIEAHKVERIRLEVEKMSKIEMERNASLNCEWSRGSKLTNDSKLTNGSGIVQESVAFNQTQTSEKYVPPNKRHEPTDSSSSSGNWRSNIQLPSTSRNIDSTGSWKKSNQYI